MDIGSINSAIDLVTKLRKIYTDTQTAEQKMLIADLLNELADVKVQMAELKMENHDLKKNLQHDEEKPNIVNGIYQFEGYGDNLYCTGCYDTKKQKVLLQTALNPSYYRCPVCEVTYDNRYIR